MTASSVPGYWDTNGKFIPYQQPTTPPTTPPAASTSRTGRRIDVDVHARRRIQDLEAQVADLAAAATPLNAAETSQYRRAVRAGIDPDTAKGLARLMARPRPQRISNPEQWQVSPHPVRNLRRSWPGQPS